VRISKVTQMNLGQPLMRCSASKGKNHRAGDQGSVTFASALIFAPAPLSPGAMKCSASAAARQCFTNCQN